MVPVIAATLGGMIVRALQVFFITKAVTTLAAFGMAIGVYIGLDSFVEMAGQQIQSVLASAQSVTIWGSAIDVMGLISASGFIDAINIMLSCHLTALSIKTAKVGVFGLSK